MTNTLRAALDQSQVRAGTTRPREPSGGLLTFVALAWSTTWLLCLPLVSSQSRGQAPRPFLIALAGASAFGPSFAAFVVARRQGKLREVFGQFRFRPLWLVVALLLPMSLHLLARAIERALGGDIVRWFWLPQTTAQLAALVAFSVGEEFGWRGFAHPRLYERYGPVIGPLATGLIWGIWHLAYVMTPSGTIDVPKFAVMLLEFMLWSLIIAWLFERNQRNMAVAISLHAGGHLDNAAQIPPGNWRLHLLVLLVLSIAGALAAWSLKAGAVKLRSRSA